MTLASKLNPGSTYYVLIDNYALKDDENRTFSGVSSGSMWSFTAKSTGAVANVSPTGGSTGVNPASDLQLGFDRPMMPNAG
ncbi:hypothetical protein JI735_06225 [Paenibacillus sonchi]|uniref:SbsA Ig-like domain-containing protein n=2 Tax=Paenibacillus sonchi TaxID=373687 RepID=A0A974PFB2_9BACL|nr:hypothetical protein JI735_06225 [Paenibacillus sonchi]